MSVIFKGHGSDMFDGNAQVLINPVNCVGAMGKGLALVFKDNFPANFQAYREACNKRTLRPGHFLAVSTGGSSPSHIINLATKDHWRDPSRIEWIRSGAARVRDWAEQNNVRSVACPALGSGLGQLNWDDVRAILLATFDSSPVLFDVHEPHELKKETFLETKKEVFLETKNEANASHEPPPHEGPAPAKRLVFRRQPR